MLSPIPHYSLKEKQKEPTLDSSLQWIYMKKKKKKVALTDQSWQNLQGTVTANKQSKITTTTTTMLLKRKEKKWKW